MLVTQTFKRSDDAYTRTMLSDISNAVGLAQQNTAIQFLPANMKEAFISGIQKCLSHICEMAWDWYTDHDVPEDQPALLRTVVEYHYLQGDEAS